MTFQLPQAKLEQLRDRLQARGRSRRSMLLLSTVPSVIEAESVLEEYGALCEIMYLMMAADRRVLNVEREVMRGALDILSNGTVRTAHMDAMIDATARQVARHGEEFCLNRAMDALRSDPVRAETAVVLAAAVAVADAKITPEEEDLLDRLAAGLDIDAVQATRLIEDFLGDRE